MAGATIEVSLSGGETTGTLTRYRPGETIRGEVLVIPDGDLRCNHLRARLKWHTEGRGDRDQETVAEADLFQGTLPAGMPRQYPFAFELPRQPWSYAGKYINIIWQIEVVIDVPMAKDPTHRQPFILAPDPV